MGNVGEQTYRVAAPEATYALWQGQGSGTGRLQRGYATTDPDDLAWGRLIESVGDGRDTEDPAQLVERATDQVLDGRGQVEFSFEPQETDASRYGISWDIGDRCTVYPAPPGAPAKLGAFDDLVREISIETAGDTDTVRAAIGSESATTGAPLPDTQRLRRINTDLRALQRST